MTDPAPPPLAVPHHSHHPILPFAAPATPHVSHVSQASDFILPGCNPFYVLCHMTYLAYYAKRVTEVILHSLFIASHSFYQISLLQLLGSLNDIKCIKCGKFSRT